MSAPVAVGCLLLLGVVIGVGWLLSGYLGDFLLFPSAEWEFNQDYRTRARVSDDQMLRDDFRESKINPEIPARIRRIFGRQFQLDPERLRPHDDFASIDWDLDLVELIQEIEESFGVEISNKDLESSRGTIFELSRLVHDKMHAAGIANPRKS